MLLDCLDSKRQYYISVHIDYLLNWIVLEGDPGVPACINAEILSCSFGIYDIFFRKDDSSYASLRQFADQIVDLFLGMMFQSYESQEDLVCLSLSHLPLKLLKLNIVLRFDVKRI